MDWITHGHKPFTASRNRLSTASNMHPKCSVIRLRLVGIKCREKDCDCGQFQNVDSCPIPGWPLSYLLEDPFGTERAVRRWNLEGQGSLPPEDKSTSGGWKLVDKLLRLHSLLWDTSGCYSTWFSRARPVGLTSRYPQWLSHSRRHNY